jgi:hypothetical protein
MPEIDGTTAEQASTVVLDSPRDGVSTSVVILTVLEADPPANWTPTVHTTVEILGITADANSMTRWS